MYYQSLIEKKMRKKTQITQENYLFVVLSRENRNETKKRYYVKGPEIDTHKS